MTKIHPVIDHAKKRNLDGVYFTLTIIVSTVTFKLNALFLKNLVKILYR